MQGYYDYIKDVQSGLITASNFIKQAVDRLERLKARDDIYFDTDAVNECFEFIRSMKHFAGKSAGKEFELLPYQKWVIGSIIGIKYKATGYRVCRETFILQARKNGKALSIDTPIPTPDGWATMGDLQIGDYVLGQDGKPTRVTNVTPVMYNHKCYKVSFTDGEEIIADADHNWYVKHRYRNNWEVLTTEQLLKDYRRIRQDNGYTEHLYKIPMNEPLECPDIELPIDPYVLGCWLGDGTTCKPEITVDGNDIDMYEAFIEQYGIPRLRFDTRNNTLTLCWTGDRKDSRNSALRKALIEADVFNNKHIPTIYLRASIEQRLSLLQGLMDTDGTINKTGECEFVQKSDDITDGFCELLSSLGIKYSRTKKTPILSGKTCNEVNRVIFYTDKTMPCFRLPRKYERLKDIYTRKGFKTITNIEPVNSVPVKCITVDNDNSLYLAGKKFTVTHNSSLISALSLYMLICDREQSPSIGIVASTRDQARICFEMCQNYAKSLDKEGSIIKSYRNYIKTPFNNGELKVYSSDSSNLDGLSQSMTILDEGHAQKDNLLYSVMKSSMGFRTQPLMVQITTAGFLLEGYPCYETYKVSLEILAGIKTDDSFFPFIYMMDPDDDWEDENNWIKANPALGTTITKEYLRDQMTAAKNDSSQLVPVKTKNFNMWCNAANVWISQDKVVKCMKNWSLDDFQGKCCYVGVDLASVSDLTALCVMIPEGDKFYFKNWAFIPRETFNNSPNHQLYERFYNDGNLIITEGNITDYQAVTNKIMEISHICPVQGIYYDPYNSGQWAIQCTDLGFNMVQFRQGLLNFNNPTKEMEKIILSEKAVFDKSAMVLWQFGNVVLKVDAQQNCKPDKTSNNSKIDNVVASVECMGGFLQNPVTTDFDLFVL